jgi:hypothetical protein
MPGFFLPRLMMSLQRLLGRFDPIRELPVEIPEIRDAIVALGFQDNIRFIPCDKMNPAQLRGVFYQFTRHPRPYAEPELRTLIIYSSQMPPEWQRLVCAKELIHVMDGKAEKTKTPTELQGLIDKIIGPLSTEDFGLADVMAAKDKLAVYQALGVIFPDAARADALEAMKNGMTRQRIMEQASIPMQFAALVLAEEWPAIKKDICAI